MAPRPLAQPETPVRCAIYTRQSVDSDCDLSSCEVQYEACRAFVHSQAGAGWVSIADRFDDEGYSGATLARPALDRLLGVVRSGGADRVIVYRLDRLSRSLRHFVQLSEELRHHNVALTIVSAPMLGAAAFDNMMLNVMASFAEFEREMTATRIAEAREYLKSRGRRVAGAVPFGYSADLRTKQLVVVPEEAEIVSRMFQWAAAKMTPSTIAALANAQGWRTRNNNRWTPRQVQYTLTNYVYAGLVLDGYGFRKGCHEGLITQEIYDQVQALLAERRSRKPGRANVAIPWPLLGLVRCGSCGRPLSTHTIRRGSVIYRYYRCRSTAGGREPCKGVLVRAHEVESAVLQAAGLEQSGLTSKEEEAAFQSAIRQVVFEADTGRIQIEFRPGVSSPAVSLA
ncbi:MAG: recombinase family protein [Bryobacterales bacterium]|nr:recombinase family protein [Bryobacterales bacterium]